MFNNILKIIYYSYLNNIKMNYKTGILLFICGAAVIGAFYVYYLPNSNNNDKEKNYDNDEDNDLNKNKSFFDFIGSLKDYKQENTYQIKGSGNGIVCDALSKITGNTPTQNYEFEVAGTNGSSKVIVDCFDKQANIAVDYKDANNYDYEEENMYNTSITDFYLKTFYSNLKDNYFIEKGIEYYKVPYIVDLCYKLGGETVCEDKVTDRIREQRISDYLRESVSVY